MSNSQTGAGRMPPDATQRGLPARQLRPPTTGSTTTLRPGHPVDTPPAGPRRASPAPSVQGEADAVAMAQALAGVEPDTITYVEAHGTGTELGDPIEVAALTQAFRAGTRRNGFCAIGSVKSNIGHLDTAAGVAGLI